ncbi:hypothetical protein QYE76_041277 [Lolium multiflorum]|uniref:Uncharacterized protein n=1 Tax=Lolium multiflorum TaxID=4521 RepID=A0AAD8TEM8_LOLMU|nr:hypothetical protein QYE76_041277 [Lolium multiflorum]
MMDYGVSSVSFVAPLYAREMSLKLPRGSWEGSKVAEVDIWRLWGAQCIPEWVECCVPGDEMAPVTQLGEVIVFVSHFERGVGMPVSDFFWWFVGFFGLETHDLHANVWHPGISVRQIPDLHLT